MLHATLFHETNVAQCIYTSTHICIHIEVYFCLSVASVLVVCMFRGNTAKGTVRILTRVLMGLC